MKVRAVVGSGHRASFFRAKPVKNFGRGFLKFLGASRKSEGASSRLPVQTVVIVYPTF